MSKKNPPKPETIRARALADYETAFAAVEPDARGLRAVEAGGIAAGIAKRYGIADRDYVRGLSDPVVYRENGTRNPLALPANPTRRAIASAVAKRRREGGTLARLDTLPASASAALGVRVSRAAVESYLLSAKVERTRDYSGRGTKARATETRGDGASRGTDSAVGAK
jgi:hypothetical protein